jgi:hypothetical protein
VTAVAQGPVREDADEVRFEADRLMEEAAEWKEESTKCLTLARECEAKAAKLRAKAVRLENPELGVKVKRRVPKNDSLLAAAGLAVEDIRGNFDSAKLAELLGIGTARARDILCELVAIGKIERVGNGYRCEDADAAAVRDAVIELGDFTEESLAEHLGWPVAAVRWYVEDLCDRGILDFSEDETADLAYKPTGPETVITSRPRHTPPEKLPPAGTDIRSPRGITQMISMSDAQRRNALSQPGVRLRVKNRERARERMQTARDTRAQQQRAKARKAA